MNRTGVVLLEFNAELNHFDKKKQLRDGLSAVLQIQNTLWVVNDETICLERLTRLPDDETIKYGAHEQFSLHDFLRLPVPPAGDDIEEADIEGLDYHDSYLWLVGSHSLKRKKAEENKTVAKNRERLAGVESEGNRFLLARIPLSATLRPEKSLMQDGRTWTAAQLRNSEETEHQNENELLPELRKDEHLSAFLALPGKDNGFDIEGLVVTGDRIFVGLRGPVLRGWAVILELQVEDEAEGTLRLKRIGPDNRAYRKHFLQLEGLGIRDLCRDGNDLLILAGPTMELDGPVTIYRWPGGAQPNEESLLFAKQLIKVMEVPFGQGDNKGKDHAEGITLFAEAEGTAPSLLIVYDANAAGRMQGESSLETDLFSFDQTKPAA